MGQISLHELALKIKGVITNSLSNEEFIVLAEVKKKSINPNSGHCYLELVDTDEKGTISTRITGIIWKDQIQDIACKFQAAHLRLNVGVKTLFKVNVTYHTVLGVGLIINDISINYIKGELEIKKDLIRESLKKENLFTKNKNLTLPIFIKRIAVLAAKESAGLKDFTETLRYHKEKIKFLIEHFNVHVQGFNARTDIVKAFQQLNMHAEKYDIVVLMRGGGSASDLEVFNDYEMAALICNCPIPVMVGIGHSTDSVILDEVAFKSALTPTDLANFINTHALNIYENIEQLKNKIKRLTDEILQLKKQNIQQYIQAVKNTRIIVRNTSIKVERKYRLFSNVKDKITILKSYINEHKDIVLNVQKKLKDIQRDVFLIEKSIAKDSLNAIATMRNNVEQFIGSIRAGNRYILKSKGTQIGHVQKIIMKNAQVFLKSSKKNFKNLIQTIHDRDPKNLINRGYSLTIFNGKTLKKLDNSLINKKITTILKSGNIESTVSNIIKES